MNTAHDELYTVLVQFKEMFSWENICRLHILSGGTCFFKKLSALSAIQHCVKSILSFNLNLLPVIRFPASYKKKENIIWKLQD